MRACLRALHASARRARVVAVLLCAFCAASLRAAAPAPTVAVLGVDPARDGAPDALAAAAVVRSTLAGIAVRVVGTDETRARLNKMPRGPTLSTDVLRGRLNAAEDAFATVDPARALKLLESAIADLARDTELTADKREMLEAARVTLAARLVGTAGPKETGAGETEAGAHALRVLADALHANPALQLDPNAFAPKVQRLFDKARAQCTDEGSGPLLVTSRPTGAKVYVEGRAVGVTPLLLSTGVPRGRQRVWVEAGGVMSMTRVITVGDTSPSIDIDLLFEGALDPVGPSLRPVTGTSFDEDVAAKIGSFLDVDELLLVGIAHEDAARWLYGVSFHVADSTSARRGAVKLDAGAGAAGVDAAARTLALFLARGDGDLRADVLPAALLPRRGDAAATTQPAGAETRVVVAAQDAVPDAAAAAGSSQEGIGVLPLVIGIGAAVVVVGALSTVAVVVFAPAPTGTLQFEASPL